jgi:hypothetical protein
MLVRPALPTLMRPLLVKRHTAPESGCFEFFPPGACRRRRQSVWCPDVMSVGGGQPRGRHHTRIEGPSSLPCRVQSRMAGILGDLAGMPCPPTVLRKSLAEQRGRARACGARGKGRTRHRRRLSPSIEEPARGAKQRRRLREQRPRRAWACQDAASAGCAPFWAAVSN